MHEVAMSLAGQAQAGDPAIIRLPATGPEFVTAMAHYHRAEIARMAGWRDRIDRTTNWAITVMAAMLSLSLSTPTAHHGVLLFAMVIVLLLLWIEARRYRFFDVYRARVRSLERNWFAQMIAPREGASTAWLAELGEDLRHPRFLMSQAQAMSRRLQRNYVWMFLILLLAWVLKVSSPKLQHEGVHRDFMQSFGDVVDQAALGPLPGWSVWLAVGVFYAGVAWLALRRMPSQGELLHGDVHV
jgi:uncharacterized membrane protein